MIAFSDLKKSPDGLVPVIVQDATSGAVLMLAYMNEAAYNATISGKQMTYFSRSRGKLWLKGEESGHFQRLVSLRADCDRDTLLATVEQTGVACHTGEKSCFFNHLGPTDKDAAANTNAAYILEELMALIRKRRAQPQEGSYTNYLFDKGLDKILKKLGEEACEVVIAAKNENPDELRYEIADLLYHLTVLMAQVCLDWDRVLAELSGRRSDADK